MKKLFILIIIISISSCKCVNKNAIYDVDNEDVNEVNLSKKEHFIIKMSMLIEFYTKAKIKTPASANDLIFYIDGMNEDSQLVYLNQYKFLKMNRKKLVFTTETEILDSEIKKTICVYYKKAIPSKGLFNVFVYLPKQTKE